MKNPFLTLLEDPASLITIEFDKAEKEMIIRMLEEKVNNAIAEYDNPEQHDDAIYNPFNEWLYYLNEMWNGKLDYTFEQWADTIGLQKYELYKMIIGLLLDKHLDYVCEHETNIDNDTLNSLRINHNIHVHDDIDSQYDYPSSQDAYWSNGDDDEDNFTIQTGAC
tara:strand:- start:27 stop:521 length:495 start_codon:yes stop_codon:yes gene_type:complete